MSDLKPCPFCGGNKLIVCRTDYDGRDAYAVSCRYHECHGSIFMLGYGYFADRAEAIAAWNTRSNDATIKAVADLIAEEHGWTRTDLIQPMIDKAVAARLEEAADLAAKGFHPRDIRALITADEAAALAEVRRQARVEGMREAMEACKGVGSPVGAGDGYGTYIRGTSADAERAIAALIAREGG